MATPKKKAPPSKELKRIIDDDNQQSFEFTKMLQNPNDDGNSKYSRWIENSAIYSCQPLTKGSGHVDDYPIVTIPFPSDNEITLSITPAIIEENGRSKLSYLQFSDEVLISVLINLICKNNIKLYQNKEKIDYTLVTTYTEIKKELKALNKTKRNEEILSSLRRLQSTTFKLRTKDGEMNYETSIIGWFKLYDPQTALKDCRLIISFNEIVEDLIKGKIKSKQYNHNLTYKGRNQLSVWFKKEVLAYATNISPTTPLKMRVEDIYFYSNQFHLKQNFSKKQKLKRALVELVEVDAQLSEIEKIIKPKFNNDTVKDILETLEKEGITKKTIDDLIILKCDSEVLHEIEAYLHKIDKANSRKLFSYAKFEMHGKEEWLYLYPTPLLIKEMMRSNASEKKELQDRKIHAWEKP